MDSHSAISFRNFASCMGDGRVLAKVDAYIQEHLLEVSEQEDFLKLPRLKVSPPSLGPLPTVTNCHLARHEKSSARAQSAA